MPLCGLMEAMGSPVADAYAAGQLTARAMHEDVRLWGSASAGVVHRGTGRVVHLNVMPALPAAPRHNTAVSHSERSNSILGSSTLEPWMRAHTP